MDGPSGSGITGPGNQTPLSVGVAPESVTDIVISHMHVDHAGNIERFPNATVHLSAPEWAAIQKDKDAAKLVAAIGPKVATFEPGAVVLPGVTAVALPGHTPGHRSLMVKLPQSGTFILSGDAVHFRCHPGLRVASGPDSR